MSEAEVLASRCGHLGSIRLNRPEALNSLNLDMVRAFAAALEDFAFDPSIHAVLVTGSGPRGLCAGGDIRRLHAMRPADRDYFETFWREEYRLNARIASFPKLYLVIMDGVVMGGGVGVSAHGNRRIVTERTRLAMPETGIGFIPDVGGTWLLTRNRGVGAYLALSGAAMGAADAIYAGLADLAIASEAIDEIVRSLATIRNAADVDAILARFAAPAAEAPLAAQQALLDRAIRAPRVEDYVAALSADGAAFAQRAVRDIAARSPISLKLTYELLKRGAAAHRLEDCLVNEFRAACRLLLSHDLNEGVRAAIIDKDRRPHWSPATLEEVDDAMVAAILEGAGDLEPSFAPWPGSELDEGRSR